MVGIGATGAAVGSRVNGAVRSNYRMDFNPAGSPYNAYFNGLNTVAGQTQQGEAFDVSDNGLYVAGWSGLGTDSANSYAYKATFAGTVWQSTSQLPVTGLETGSTAKTVAYGISPDGRWVVGGSYQGIYHAMLWDTGDANPANWTYIDLWNYATSRGILDGWTNLQRGWSVGVNALGEPVVTGEGVIRRGGARFRNNGTRAVGSSAGGLGLGCFAGVPPQEVIRYFFRLQGAQFSARLFCGCNHK